VKFIKEKMVISNEELDEDTILNSAKTSMSSKIIGPGACATVQLCAAPVLVTAADDDTTSILLS